MNGTLRTASYSQVTADFGRIGFSDEQADLLDVATSFCRDKSPIGTVRELMKHETGFDEKTWTDIAELGWLAIAIPQKFGGVGLTIAEIVPVIEQMGQSMLAGPFVSTTLSAQMLLTAGTSNQQANYLPKIATGHIATLALLEDEGNWDLSKIKTVATRNGTGKAGGVTLKGTKHLVCDGASASFIIASVMIDGEPGLVLIDRKDVPSGAIRRETIIDETKRSYAITLDGIKVSDRNILEMDQSRKALDHIQLVGALFSAAECCGSAKGVIDYTVEYLKTRKQFGKVIGSYQALKHPLVDAYVSYEQARSHLYAAAHCFGEQGTGAIATHMARTTADKALSYAADRSIQFHGGFGFTYDCDAQLYRRRAIWHAALHGDATYHKKKLAELLF